MLSRCLQWAWWVSLFCEYFSESLSYYLYNFYIHLSVGQVRPGVTVLPKTDWASGVGLGEATREKKPFETFGCSSSAASTCRRRRGFDGSGSAAGSRWGGSWRRFRWRIDRNRAGAGVAAFFSGLDRAATIHRPTGAGSAWSGAVYQLWWWNN